MKREIAEIQNFVSQLKLTEKMHGATAHLGKIR